MCTARISGRLQPSLALSCHRPHVSTLYAIFPPHQPPSIVQKHVTNSTSPWPRAAPTPQIYTMLASHVRGQRPVCIEAFTCPHIIYLEGLQGGDAGRFATGVAQPVNIAGWDSGWWVP